jgi:hypothetical protein
MPHPRAPREFVGGNENRSIEAASYPRIWDRVKRTAEVANVVEAFVGAPAEHRGERTLIHIATRALGPALTD